MVVVMVVLMALVVMMGMFVLCHIFVGIIGILLRKGRTNKMQPGVKYVSGCSW